MTTCTHPKTAWYNADKGGKPLFKLPSPDTLHLYSEIKLKCRKCEQCQASYACDWAVRCAMEMHMHKENTFLTLTYAEVDEVATLKPDDITNFIKRLRKHVFKQHGKLIRYQQCGEYGERYNRPHHHILIFGYDFPDLILKGSSGSDKPMYTSEILSKLWGHGHCVVQDANMGSATYIAGYISKKIYATKDENGSYVCGGSNNTHYNHTDKETGEIHTIHKEYMTMSRMPGVGYSFFKKYKTDMFPSGNIHLPDNNGELKQFSIPQYFFDKLAEEDPELYLKSIEVRRNKGIEFDKNQPLEKTPERLYTKAYISKKIKVQKGRILDGVKPSYHVDMSKIDHEQSKDKHYQERITQQKEFEQKHKHRLQGNYDE